MHLLLLKWDPMIGVDLHFELNALIPPTPAPFIPHYVGMFIQGITPLGPKLTGDDVVANGKHIVYKGSDISFLIPHIPIPPWPPTVLAVSASLFSGSKSYFGPASVISKQGAVAAALLDDTNVQLNCGFPIPSPTGLVFASSTVVCGMTWGDIIGGMVAMLVDMAVQTVVNVACWGAGKWAKGATAATAATGKSIVEVVAGVIVSQVVGSPVGYTYGEGTGGPNSPYNPGNYGNEAGEWARKKWDGNGSPSPSTPAASNSAPTPSHPVTNDPSVEQH